MAVKYIFWRYSMTLTSNYCLRLRCRFVSTYILYTLCKLQTRAKYTHNTYLLKDFSFWENVLTVWLWVTVPLRSMRTTLSNLVHTEKKTNQWTCYNFRCSALSQYTLLKSVATRQQSQTKKKTCAPFSHVPNTNDTLWMRIMTKYISC